MNWLEEITNLRNYVLEKLGKIQDRKELDELKLEIFKRKGKLSELKKFFDILKDEEKKNFGLKFNELKNELERIFKEKESQTTLREEKFLDVIFSFPSKKFYLGSQHIISLEQKRIIEIFAKLGFSAIDSPEVVSEKDNFDYLNIPSYHPARDLWNTIWIKKKGLLLRTHTSAYQVPYLKNNFPPFRVIFIGKVFRFEATDRRHEIQFNQIEGLSVVKRPEGNLGELKGVLREFFEMFFERKVKIRLRPSYFPFVEPGLEVDISCFCKNGCEFCSFTKYIEIAGAGMVHPDVLKRGKIDTLTFQGYAFGCGLERLLMIKYNIPDIRYFLSGDLRFIKNFS